MKWNLESRLEEVVDIKMTLFDQDYAWDRYVEEVKQNSKEEAKKEDALDMRERGFSNQDISDILNIETSKVKMESVRLSV